MAASIVDKNGQVIQLNPRALPERHNECQFCHTKKNRAYMSSKTNPTLEHSEKSARHGKVDMACQSCHNINNSNYLRSSTFAEASFENSSAVCSQCHAREYRDWRRGIHGKRLGNWNGEKVQFNCIDCHSPHSVNFKKMEAAPHPYEPKFLIHKDEGVSEH